jgi:hypothetical protein
MRSKNTADERLTEMLTFVVTPSLRAHLSHAAEQMGNAPYAFPARMAIAKYLAETDPLSGEELAQLTADYLRNKEAGHK